MIVRIELRREDWTRVVTTWTALSGDQFEFAATESSSLAYLRHAAVRRHLATLDLSPVDYAPAEDGAEVVIEYWDDGDCRAVLDPDFAAIAELFLLLGHDPDVDFSSGRRHEQSRGHRASPSN